MLHMIRNFTSFYFPRHLIFLVLCPLAFVGINLVYNKSNPPPEIWVGTCNIRIPSEYRGAFLNQTARPHHLEKILANVGLSRDLSPRSVTMFSKSFSAKPIPETTLVEITVKGYNEGDVSALIEATVAHLLSFQEDLGGERLESLQKRVRDLDELIRDLENQRDALRKYNKPTKGENGLVSTIVTVLDAQIKLQINELKISLENAKYEYGSRVTLRMGKSVVTKQVIRSTALDSAVTAGFMGLALAVGLISALHLRGRRYRLGKTETI